MAWRSVDVQEQRVRFVVAASRGEASVAALCGEFGISRATGHVWLKRYRSGGVAAVAEQSRRPGASPRRTEAAIEERVVTLRRERPDWGARKLAVLLAREGLGLPAATVHRILLRRGLVRVEDGHAQAPRRFERTSPTNSGRWTSRAPRDGASRSVRSR